VSIGILFHQYVNTGAVQGDVYYSDFQRQTRVVLLLPECLGFFFLLLAIVFIPIGQRIGEDLKAVSPPLQGYIINILGSLAGVLAFAAISFLGLGPWWWFAIAMLGLLWFVRREKDWCVLNLLIAALTILTVWLAGEMYYWTPYNKLAVRPLELNDTGLIASEVMVRPSELATFPKSPGFNVAVNDDFYQAAVDLSPHSPLWSHSNTVETVAHYETPFSIPGFSYNDVLIVGAGSGNDVAGALRHGAEHVDAVEIDPGIYRLGQILHPEQPYSDPRVHVSVEDARTFFNRTRSKYDLIVFGLLDAHHLFSSMSSVRLDSFVYTVESFQEARQLLKENGIIVVQHALGNAYMNARMYQMLSEAFGVAPYVKDANSRTPIFFAGPGVKKFIQRHTSVEAPAIDLATDDWPFFYLGGRKLPPEYRVALEAMALVTLVCLLSVSPGKMRSVNGHFFFLGAAFLLIEAVSVTRFAMLFGSTWMVNSIVFSAILLVILLANLWMDRIPSISIHWLYGLLAVAVVINFMFPIHALLHTRLLVRLLVSMMLMASPIFFAAFIFGRSYKQAADVDLAFASNLLGAVIGGLIEYSSLVIGFRDLWLVALGLYLLSYVMLFWPSRKTLMASA
jgi:SAM-dependent methyltransferase